ncbi:MAG TPA: hypothetical protein VGJ83_03960 [Gemmatimonadales bacterium]
MAAAAAGACGDEPSNPALLTAADSSNGDSIPRDSTPRDTVAPDTVPRDTIPRDTIPRDTIPRDTIPRDTIPPDTIPRDTIPRDTIPRDTIPRDTIPRDTVPPASGPVSITVTPATQERAVGDSGVVTATVRDSTGREIWPAAIEWDLSDTSSVLRIRVRRTSFVIFDAVGPGRATLIARFQTLADTGVVIVR